MRKAVITFTPLIIVALLMTAAQGQTAKMSAEQVCEEKAYAAGVQTALWGAALR